MAKLNDNYGDVFSGLDRWAKSMDEILNSAVPVPTKKQRKKMKQKQEKTFIVKVTVKETEAPVETVEAETVATEAAKAPEVELVNATNVEAIANAAPEVETPPVEKAQEQEVVTAKPAEQKTEQPSIPKLNPSGKQGKKGKAGGKTDKAEKNDTKSLVVQPQVPEAGQQQQQKPLKIAATIVGFNAFGQAIDINGTPLVGINGLPLVINPATGLFEEAIPVPPTVQIPSQSQA